MKQPRHAGMTLIELLVVLALIGILMGLFGWNLVRSIRSAELREAATQVAVDLRRARSQAQRGSADVTLTLPTSATGASNTSYAVRVGSGASQTRTLDKGVTLNCRSTGGNCGSATTVNVVYQAPYGELGAVGNIFEVKSPTQGITPIEIRVVGVTGKVIVTQGTP